MRAILTIILCLVITTPTLAADHAQFTASVISVADGVTLTVLAKGIQQIKIRLYGIDCPERGREFWSRAKQATSDAVFGKLVTVLPVDTDSDGRTVAVIFMPGGKSLNEHLVREGLAWIYQHCTQENICTPLRSLEKAAKVQKRGMWEDRKSVPEAEWMILPGGGGPTIPGSAPR
ncbi:MAG: thermonuclease family protein [Betaproteobacteria bacterium]|nr:thermonuclease family protein [Betaproteobacteria bacterium]